MTDNATPGLAAEPVGRYRVLVTGSRTWTDHEAVLFELAGLSLLHGGIIVVHGAARDGADRFAHLAAVAIGAPEERHPADWKQHNRRPGYIRNEAMVATRPQLVLAFIATCELDRCAGRKPHGTHGSTHCADLAEKAGLEVRRLTHD